MERLRDGMQNLLLVMFAKTIFESNKSSSNELQFKEAFHTFFISMRKISLVLPSIRIKFFLSVTYKMFLCRDGRLLSGQHFYNTACSKKQNYKHIFGMKLLGNNKVEPWKMCHTRLRRQWNHFKSCHGLLWSRWHLRKPPKRNTVPLSLNKFYPTLWFLYVEPQHLGNTWKLFPCSTKVWHVTVQTGLKENILCMT